MFISDQKLNEDQELPCDSVDYFRAATAAALNAAVLIDMGRMPRYALVGTPMVSTMITQFAVPPVMHLVMFYGVNGLTGKLARSGDKIVTQTQLNRSYAPPESDFAARYGEILLAMSVTLIFAPGIPVLYWVAFVGFGTRYCVEKFVDLRVYKRCEPASSSLN